MQAQTYCPPGLTNTSLLHTMQSYFIRKYIPMYQPQGAVLWGATAFTAAVFLIQACRMPGTAMCMTTAPDAISERSLSPRPSRQHT